jgi:ketosteroid isomerase-like protein
VEHTELLEAVYARWARGDYGGVSWAADDIEFSFEADFPDRETFTGPGAAQRGWGRWLREWSDVRVSAERFLEAPEGRMVVLVRVEGEGRASGAAIVDSGANVWTFGSDGRAVALAVYSNREAALRDAGLSA